MRLFLKGWLWRQPAIGELRVMEGLFLMSLKIAARLCGALLVLSLSISVPAEAAEATQSSGIRIETASEGFDWSPPKNVSESFLIDSDAPALAVTGSGVAHLVWEEDGALLHSYRSGLSWSSPAPISGTGDGAQPALAAGPGDGVHLVYVNAPDIYHLAWDGSSWGLPRNISDTSSNSDSPDLAVASDGSIHVAASEQAGPDRALYYARSEDGSSWPNYGFIPNAYGHGPSVDVTGTTTLTVQIAYRESLVPDIYTVQRIGATWSLPEAVTNTPASFSTAPQLILDDGTARIAWREVISDTDQVQYAHGPVWSPVTLSQSSTGTTSPALALNAQGSFHAAWGEGAESSFQLLHTRSSEGASWQEPEPVDAGRLAFDDVVLVGTAGGTLHAAWVEGRTGEVWYASWPHYRVYLPLLLKG
jgi:hypothetical protein